MTTPRRMGWVVAAFFALIVALVFQQIATSMTEQGIASGGPYDNAADYPRTVAIFIGLLIGIQLIADNFSQVTEPVPDSISLKRPIALLVIFALYLVALSPFGYHLTTTPMVFAIMWVCGARQIGRLIIAAIAMSFGFAFIFEKFLNVVLPGGMFGLNIAW